MTIDAKKKAYLTRMGIDVWQRRDLPEEKPAVSVLPAHSSADLSALKSRVSSCTLCGLCETRTQTVFGVGSSTAEIMIVGEAPGANEDRQGEPFVGRAGQLLTQMLKAISLSRDDVFIANILKCRPPNNRDPSPEEVATCTPYLREQIALIQPKLIVAVGRIAAQFLLESTQTLGRLRGQWHDYHGTPLYVTYHPAYLLRSPREKAKAMVDLYAIKQHLGEALC
ncbi:MAG: uracil-DNA glycosylase [Gammaproteobacteria bacterium CG11_big_fil_rev_8_21_14_0_20_46_22]|nr:MAG: uracil-DNA glycosylase [Gammaproteobacteria bacterium CG12_big_fil_rev_8_21_14_0_65_46_12]PIR10665.1 MAG: uracil-DNA glycosylase [Gammaproteobacteria bacterium CG11_big_fil_rev_8_21_14_0_20_46_22]